MSSQPDAHSTKPGPHTVQRVFEGGLAGYPVAVRVAALRLLARGHPNRQAGTKVHADDQLPVDSAVEPEPTAFSNGEVRHDFRVTPDLGSRFQRECLIDGQVVDEGAGRLQGARPARVRAGRVDHHAGAELVVLAQV